MSALIVPQPVDGDNQFLFTGEPDGDGVWLEVGLYNLCIKIVREPMPDADECHRMPTIMIEAFVKGFEECEPASRLEIAYQPANFYKRLQGLEDRLAEYAKQSSEAIRIGGGYCFMCNHNPCVCIAEDA